MQINLSNISLCGQIKRLFIFKEAKQLGDSKVIGVLYLAIDEAENSQNPAELGEDFISRMYVAGHESVYTVYISDEHFENEIHLGMLGADDFVSINCKIESVNLGFAEENVVIGRYVINGELDMYVDREGPRTEPL